MFPYNRIVQWTAGPVSVGAGWLAEQLSTHVDLGAVGTNKAAVATEIVKGATFAIGAAVTYAAHHKWLDNAAKWVESTQAEAIDLTSSGGATPKPDAADLGQDKTGAAATS